MNIRSVPNLMLLSTPDGMHVYDSAARVRWPAETLGESYLAELLSVCEQWQDRTMLVGYLELLDDHPDSSASEAVDRLVAGGLLETDEQLRSQSLPWCQQWCLHGWRDALEYHRHTTLYPKMDYAADPHGEADKAMMRSYLEQEPPPASYKTINALSHIPLKRAVEVPHASFGRVLTDQVGMDRRRGPLSFDAFCWLTELAYGQTATRKLPITGSHVARTSPSGGSRHPTEVYVFALEVEGVASGLYHYSVRDHSLALLQIGDFRSFVQEHVITHPSRPAFRPTAVYVYATLFERSMYRYREARSYRVMHYDLGHLMQTTAWLASAIDRSSYRGYSLHESDVERLIGLDGLMESVMAFTAVG